MEPSPVTLDGIVGQVTIVRDEFAIADVIAKHAVDTWFGMGYVSACDRMFQMDYDRRRATGRLAEILGRSALSADVLARRLNIESYAKTDYANLGATTRGNFDAYTAGVNDALASMSITTEEELGDYRFEPWEPWQSIAAFKVRHVLMGLWQHKLASALLYLRVGPELFHSLEDRPPVGSALTVPTLDRLQTLVTKATQEIYDVSEILGFLSEVSPGSNAWAVSGSKMASGHAVLCNDSHRALDVPNVYWQVGLTCPAFSVKGATFPGFPGFPHFGQNRHVAWAITHAGADTQDLFVETFDHTDPELYRTYEGYRRAARRVEVITVRGEQPVEIEAWSTAHGPVVHGDPREGSALSLQWSGFDSNLRGFEDLENTVQATSVAELFECQRSWVDPVNNFVAIGRDDTIGYLTRGSIPIRTNLEHRTLPVPGWLKPYEWGGYLDVDLLPKLIDPEAGFIMTANNTIIDGEEPYVSMSFAEPFRAERLREILSESKMFSLADMSAIQSDCRSWAAHAWTKILRDESRLDEEGAEQARQALASWDGSLHRESGPALLYGAFRRAMAECLYRPLLGDNVWNWAVSGELAPLGRFIARWLANDLWDFLGGHRPNGFSGDARSLRIEKIRAVLPTALSMAWTWCRQVAGEDPSTWRWGDFHKTAARHPLSILAEAQGRILDPPRVEMDGDGDTVQVGSYGWQSSDHFDITNLSVYRQIVDARDWGATTSVIPGGVSGDPDSAHSIDQLKRWADHQRVPMFPHDSNKGECAES